MSGDQRKKDDRGESKDDKVRQAEAAAKRKAYEAREAGEQAGKKAAGEAARGMPETPKLPAEGLSAISSAEARRQASQEGRAPYEGLEVKPPGAAAKPIPVGEIKLEPRTPPARLLELRPHTPQAPPEGHAGKGPPDGYREQKEIGAASLSPDMVLPGERDISPEEKAERRRVAHPSDGVGFRHGADRADVEETDRWYGSLTDAKRRDLADPKKRAFILVHASRTGGENYNQALTERRAQNLVKLLRERYGIRAQIEVHALGEDKAIQSNHRDGRDNHLDRMATIDIVEGGAQAAARPPDLKAAGQAGADAGLGLGALPEKPHRETPRDVAIELLGHVLVEALGHAVDVPLTPFSVCGMFAHKLLEAHKENKEATEKGARLVGAYYAVDLIGDDAQRSDPHSAQGKPYTQSELSGRLYAGRGSPFQGERGWLVTLGTTSGADWSRVDQSIARGIQDAVEAANGLMGRFRTPEERRAGLLSLRHSVIERIDHERILRGNELLRH